MFKKILTSITCSCKETQFLACFLGKKIQMIKEDTCVILLEGSIGVGKTCFVQGLAKFLGISETVNSPTFILMKTYTLKTRKLCHLDVYRLFLNRDNIAELLEELNKGDILICETSKDFRNFFDCVDFRVKIDYLDQDRRSIFIEEKLIL